MALTLTNGSIKRIIEGESVEKPVLQLLGYKKIPGGANGDRYRLLVSDGNICHPFAMLATQLNHLIDEGQLEKHTVIRLDKYICNQVNPERKIMILLDITVLASGSDIGEKLGNPTLQEAAAPAHTEQSVQPKSTIKQEYKATYPSHGMNGHANYGSQSQGNIHPISSLTPYQNKWTIRARVTNKSQIRRWNNSRGEGHLFSMDLLDESGEIRATAFKEQCDKFYDMIEVNKVYYISKASLKPANKQFTSIKNEYEMTFNSETTVTPCEDTSSTPMLTFNFVPFDQLEKYEKDSIIDVIGVCKSTSDLQTIITRTTNREMKKKDLYLVDKTNKQVTATLWGEDAEKFDGSQNPIVAIKNVKVSDFGGRSLNIGGNSNLQINPDVREAHVLRGWYDREGTYLEMENLSAGGPGSSGGLGAPSSWKSFAQVQDEIQNITDKPLYFTTKAMVTMVKKENCLYQACPSSDCNKKIIDMNNGTYRCEKCQREYGNFEWRLLLSMNIADFSGDYWVTCFQEAAEIILETKAAELGALKETDEERLNAILDEVTFKSFIFRLRTKMENFNEENRLRTTVMSASSVNPQDYGKKLLSDIATFGGSF